MGIEDLPMLKIPELINLNGGSLEVEEGDVVPRRAILKDPKGNTMLADITNPSYVGGKLNFSYSGTPITH